MDKLNVSGKLFYKVVFKDVMMMVESIINFMKEVNYNDKVVGVIIWMYIFLLVKNWICGIELL